jgi:CheY-like chemotaxis protein
MQLLNIINDIIDISKIEAGQVEVNIEESNINNLKILIAEDDKASDLLITLSLLNFCCEVLHVKNGVEAVPECRNNPDLDLVLMDIKMPRMNGYENR